ncbi:hypothetical protein ACH5RR_036785 [Cinchona calisaya]|uniref:DNA topoisomerase n=1 Tax=Cinchona calisaya TaxID=153742 RepID=A0ABD2Y5M7_9GENT
MESIQDMLAPEKTSIPSVEDGRTGEVSVPGATVVKIQNLDQLVQLTQIGEANHHASNTKLNSESSCSYAILMVFVRRSVPNQERSDVSLRETDNKAGRPGHHIPTIRKSKLLIVDPAGFKRLDKSGKCINALAENSPHIPTRDSKLTRLLRDSFGGMFLEEENDCLESKMKDPSEELNCLKEAKLRMNLQMIMHGSSLLYEIGDDLEEDMVANYAENLDKVLAQLPSPITGGLLNGISAAYTDGFACKDPMKKQIAVAIYLVDKLALRAGNEKDDDEADTVGCCTLKSRKCRTCTTK